MTHSYSLNLSDEVKKGMAEKARRGELQMPAPFGYRMIDGLLTPQKDEAEMVRDIFHKYVNENMNLRQIAKYVNEIGFKTKMGNAVDKRLIEYMIYNPVYTGKIRWTPTGSAVCNHDFDNPDTIITEGRHTAIVDTEIWEKANKKIRVRAKAGWAHRHDDEVTTHWLRGILRCAACGTALSFGKGYGNKNSAYRCNKYLNGACATSQRIIVPKIENAVLSVIRKDGEKFYDILISSVYSLTQKNNALKEIVYKIIYNKDSDVLEFYYYYSQST